MSNDKKSKAEKQAIELIREHKQFRDADAICRSMREGDRASLASAITLLESTSPDKRQLADDIIECCMPFSGKSIRIGITGVPGVGKSTFIDTFGSYLTSIGKKVAVLAIDPTSPVSGGSILGDKTRMSRLSMDANAFIRPSPSAKSVGGVARRTRESIILCEASGFDLIIVETVGVGQGEVAVHSMTDFFMLLMLAGAGDQLQGIKRGIIEMADSIFITKSDSGNEQNAMKARAEYSSALHLFPANESGWMPRVEALSAQVNRGIEVSWDIIDEHHRWMVERNLFQVRRQEQDIQWMHNNISELIRDKFFAQEGVLEKIKQFESSVRNGEISPFTAARKLTGS